MRVTSKLDFLAAFGEELCGTLSPPVSAHLIVPNDAYEVWRLAFGSDPIPDCLRQ
jgi:hypothetical protein